MRLLSLVITDFRGFYGVQQVDFASDDVKRVTVLHGENGAGKTNFLNAIHWCITGKFTPRFQDQKLLVNKEAAKEGQRECSVEILFKDEESSAEKSIASDVVPRTKSRPRLRCLRSSVETQS